MMRVDELHPAPYNPRDITPQALAALRASIHRFGIVQDVVWNRRSGLTVSGHQRLKVLRADGVAEVETVVVDLDEMEEKALNLTMNSDRLTGHFTEGLTILQEEIRVARPDLATDLRLDEIRIVLPDGEGPVGDGGDGGGAGGNGPATEDDPPIGRAEELLAKWQVRPGDAWEIPSRTVIGKTHRILCGDCTKAENIARLTMGAKANLCWTDPPWNVAYGNNAPEGAWRREQRQIINDNLGDRFPDFCRDFVAQIKASILPGGLLYMAMSAQEWPVIDKALRDAGFHWSSTIIWAKDRLVMSRKDYHTQYEPVWYGWDDRAARLAPLTEDRTQSDLWNIPRPSRSDEHPTMKPVELVARSIRNSSRPGDLIFEPFSGSGTTLVAGEQMGRCVYAIELDPKYVAVALERLSSLGCQPRLAARPEA